MRKMELGGSQVGVVAVLTGFFAMMYLFSKQFNLSASGDIFNFVLLGFGLLALLLVLGAKGGASLDV